MTLPNAREGAEAESQPDSLRPFDRLMGLVDNDLDRVNTLIRERMASEYAPRIPEISAHLIEAGGKRLRPILTLAAAHLCGYRGGNHVKLAAAVEFIHTATLLHDDVVDESARRRGRPTANILFDNKSSVLVGDYLFARSFRLMVECGSLRVLQILSDASAVIAEGEVLQLTTAGNIATDLDAYTMVIRGKTAALFAAAAEVGGVVAGADEETVARLRTFGDALGVAFQLADDWLDYAGADAALGKNTGDDFREGKVTMPVIQAIAHARAHSDTEAEAFWTRTIARGRQEDGDLDTARRLVAETGALDATLAAARAEIDRAIEALSVFEDSPLKRAMVDTAGAVVSRAT
ncbi:MAG: polyprenyl synthetase family protein [Pseudomonadota bacterium]